MSELRAVLFDMDGTLCDSEPAWIAAEQAMANRYDAEWTEEDGLHLVGSELIHSGAYIKDKMRLTQSPAEVVDELIGDVLRSVTRDGVDWRPGALDLVRGCNDAEIPTALVTMSYRNFADCVVAAMPYGRFDTVVTGDEVARGKPHPEPYLAAARGLGVDIDSCVAIEDSPTGAASAYAAGCLVIVVPNHVEVPLSDGMVERRSLAHLDVDGLRVLFADAQGRGASARY